MMEKRIRPSIKSGERARYQTVVVKNSLPPHTNHSPSNSYFEATRAPASSISMSPQTSSLREPAPLFAGIIPASSNSPFKVFFPPSLIHSEFCNVDVPVITSNGPRLYLSNVFLRTGSLLHGIGA